MDTALSPEARTRRIALKRDYQRAYMKSWRRKNPDKVAEIQRRYWEKRSLNVVVSRFHND